MEERGVEDRDVRDVGQFLARDLHPDGVRRIVQRRKDGQLGDGLHHVVVDERRFVEHVAAVNDPVPDGCDTGFLQRPAQRLEHVQHRAQTGPVVEDLAHPFLGSGGVVEDDPPLRLTDALDESVRYSFPGFRVYELELDRRRTRIEDQDGPRGQRGGCAHDCSPCA